MRVHVIGDMEGVAGIVKWGQTTGGDTALYQEGRVLYTEEMNAAVRGAKAAGATEIVVMDCHGAGGDYTFNSLVPDLLDPDCEYVVQSEWTEYTDLWSRVRRGAVRRHARDGRQRDRRPLAHRLRAGVAEPPLQRDARRRDGINARCAGTGAVPSCSSPATAPCATRRARCSATA
jgi:D-aminopeptidase